MLKVLSLIGESLNRANILWAVGASMLLNQYGLEDKPGDIDILVDVGDAGKADQALEAIGQKKQAKSAGVYATKHFYQYSMSGVDVDVMAGFAIRHSAGIFQYLFDQKSVTERKLINGVPIPFTSLEDWVVLYEVMPARGVKADAIAEYLLKNGLAHPDLLQRSLKGALPNDVRHKICALLEGGLQGKI